MIFVCDAMLYLLYSTMLGWSVEQVCSTCQFTQGSVLFSCILSSLFFQGILARPVSTRTSLLVGGVSERNMVEYHCTLCF